MSKFIWNEYFSNILVFLFGIQFKENMFKKKNNRIS